MARRRTRKDVNKKAVSSPQKKLDGEEVKVSLLQDKQAEALLHQEVERKSVAVRAIRDMEIEHTMTSLRLIRSYFTEEKLQTNVMQFFKENFPNLSMLRNEETGELEVQWNRTDCDISIDDADGNDIHASLLRRISMAYPYCSTVPSFGGYELSNKRARTSYLDADSLQVLEEPSDSQMLGMHDALQTPGATSQRLSYGMTPKTRRLPKPGEMLLSVHGSPLGVYKEDNMEAINESEEGCSDSFNFVA